MPRLQQGPFALCSSSCPPASLSRRPPCFQDPHPAVGALSLPAPGGQARAAEWDSGPSSQLCGTGYVKSLYLGASGSFRYASPSPASFPLGWGPPAPRKEMHPLAPEVPPPGSPPRSRRSPGAPPGPELRGASWIHPPTPAPAGSPAAHLILLRKQRRKQGSLPLHVFAPPPAGISASQPWALSLVWVL